MSVGSRTSRFILAYPNCHLERIASFMALDFVVAKSSVLTEEWYTHIRDKNMISVELKMRYCE